LDLIRENHEAAIKLLGAMFFATLVAFAAFVIKPTDVNTRFGVGVGALFAVATSAVIVAGAVSGLGCKRTPRGPPDGSSQPGARLRRFAS